MNTVLSAQLRDQLLLPRLKHAHKGFYGHVLIMGGGRGMPGAVALAARAALRVGAGMVSVATWPDYARQPLPELPEAMIHAITHAHDLTPLLAKATVCVLGPGLGEDEWAKQLYSAVIVTPHPLVIDASALRLLAASSEQSCNHVSRKNWVLTPHPGEAAVLLNCTIDEVQANRLAAAKRIQQHYGGTVVLKGHESIIVDTRHNVSICTAGNPGMATAGMGDVLSGVIGGLVAQGINSTDATRLGVWLHATAGDYAAKTQGERGLIASDLMPYLHQLSNPVKPI